MPYGANTLYIAWDIVEVQRKSKIFFSFFGFLFPVNRRRREMEGGRKNENF